MDMGSIYELYNKVYVLGKKKKNSQSSETRVRLIYEYRRIDQFFFIIIIIRNLDSYHLKK